MGRPVWSTVLSYENRPYRRADLISEHYYYTGTTGELTLYPIPTENINPTAYTKKSYAEERREQKLGHRSTMWPPPRAQFTQRLRCHQRRVAAAAAAAAVSVLPHDDRAHTKRSRREGARRSEANFKSSGMTTICILEATFTIYPSDPANIIFVMTRPDDLPLRFVILRHFSPNLWQAGQTQCLGLHDIPNLDDMVLPLVMIH